MSTSEPPRAEPPLRTILLLALAAFAGALNIRISDPLLAQVAAGFSTTVGTAAIIVTAFTVGYGL
jgi:predicted MFS family arabinose efflux permease